MSATNTTPNIGLPSFIGTDKPSWLTDWNGAMSTIDSEVGGLKTDLSGDETRIGNLENSVSSLNTTVSNHTASITALNTQVSNQGGTINTITSLIGNGTPTTTDQTLIGAINELNAYDSGVFSILEDRTESYTPDGVETTTSAITKLMTLFKNAVNALPDGYYREILRVTINGANGLSQSPLMANGQISGDAEVLTSLTLAGANGVSLFASRASSDSARVRAQQIDIATDGTVTYTDLKNTTASGSYNISYRLFVKKS